MNRITLPLVIIILLASCGFPSTSSPQPIDTDDIQIAASQIVIMDIQKTITHSVASVFMLTPTITSTPTTPELSPRVKEILLQAKNNPELDLHTFSKVGDCQMTSGTFLGGFANGKYVIPEGYEATVKWFSESMESESITAANGLGINSVLNPMFGLAAGYGQYGRNETLLDCELRTRRPGIVLVAVGTNWKSSGEISFEKYLRIVVERIIETGGLPIPSTKAIISKKIGNSIK